MAYPSKTFNINLETQRIVGTIDDRQAVMQFIEKTLATNKYSWGYYDQSFGNELEKLLGKNKGIIMAKLPILIKQALLTDDRIINVRDFEYEDDEYESDIVKVSFWITTIYSEEYYSMKLNY